MLRKPSRRLLGVHEVAVDGHLKHAARTFDHLGLDAQLLFDRGGQTGRLGVVVSHHAVFDGNRGETRVTHLDSSFAADRSNSGFRSLAGKARNPDGVLIQSFGRGQKAFDRT